MNELKSGESTFELSVPYTLYETGSDRAKPLMVYLHGFKQNSKIFKRLMHPLTELEAYHLFIQGPYPVYDRKRNKTVDQWGRSWYLYDGRAEQFVSSLEEAAQFLDRLLEDIYPDINTTRTAMVGYSMGGYLAGYYGLSRADQIDELAVMGSRIKTEVFKEEHSGFEHLNVLALHGRQDRSVKSDPQKKSCAMLAGWGASVTFKELEEGHRLSSVYPNEVKKWLTGLGYQ